MQLRSLKLTLSTTIYAVVSLLLLTTFEPLRTPKLVLLYSLIASDLRGGDLPSKIFKYLIIIYARSKINKKY